MASRQVMSPSAVPELMNSVKRLTPSELRRFQREFARWQGEQGGLSAEDTALVDACTARLDPADKLRLGQLIAKSERGTLNAQELTDYQALIRRAETLDAMRLAALTQLARRWDKPVRAVMDIVGWQEDGNDAATRRTARGAKARTRSRR